MMDIVSTEAAPAAIGPYVQAIAADGWLYTSGQIPLTPAGEMVEEPLNLGLQRGVLVRGVQACLVVEERRSGKRSDGEKCGE